MKNQQRNPDANAGALRDWEVTIMVLGNGCIHCTHPVNITAAGLLRSRSSALPLNEAAVRKQVEQLARHAYVSARSRFVGNHRFRKSTGRSGEERPVLQ